MDRAVPIQSIYDLNRLSEAGYERTVTATPAELVRIAEWEELDGVTNFEGRVTLKRISQNRFAYSASLDADVVQSCVVTVEPVKSHISRRFSRELHYTPMRHDDQVGVISLAPTEDDAPDEIDSLKFDLAGPLLEEFSLAVDPYPRAPGVAFEPPVDEPAKPANPFAVLKGFKQG
jgi:uncharacterized metal-binding protein YceD (DUF177 family)